MDAKYLTISVFVTLHISPKPEQTLSHLESFGSINYKSKTWTQTSHNVADESEGKTDDVDQEVGAGEVGDEEVRGWAHARTTVDDGDHEAVAGHPHNEHHRIRYAEQDSDGDRVNWRVRVVCGVIHDRPGDTCPASETGESTIILRRHVGKRTPENLLEWIWRFLYTTVLVSIGVGMTTGWESIRYLEHNWPGHTSHINQNQNQFSLHSLIVSVTIKFTLN